MTSPFPQHRDMVMGHYSTAAWMRTFVLAMSDDAGEQVDLADFRYLDHEHARAAVEMLDAYRDNPHAPGFASLVEACRQRRREEQAAAIRDRALEAWLPLVTRALRQRGLYAGMAEDKYAWFAVRFDAGDTPEQAAQRAQDDNLQAYLG